MKVLISPGYGSGWSTWNSPEMAFDEVLIRAFECGITKDDMQALCMQRGYADEYGDKPYMGGFDSLVVKEVPSGALFKIREFDGSEYIDIFDEGDWYLAEGEYYDID